MKILRDNLCAFLEEKRGLASKLAEVLGVDKSQISHWKSGKEDVPEQYNATIAEFLGKSLDQLCRPPLGAYGEFSPKEHQRKIDVLVDTAKGLSLSQLNKLLAQALLIQESDSK